jgi:hypothetical protein
MTKPFSQAARDGAVALVRVLEGVPMVDRMDAVVLLANYGCATHWFTQPPTPQGAGSTRPQPTSSAEPGPL